MSVQIKTNPHIYVRPKNYEPRYFPWMSLEFSREWNNFLVSVFGGEYPVYVTTDPVSGVKTVICHPSQRDAVLAALETPIKNNPGTTLPGSFHIYY